MRLLILSYILHTVVGQDCTFSSALWGTWTTTNLGAVNISSGTPSMTTSLTLTGSTGAIDFNCLHISGTQYILRSSTTIAVFSGTTNVYAYMCMDLRAASTYSYYFYMNSGEEVGFGGMRMVGLATTTATVAQVCTTTLAVEEFNMMVKVGNEKDAVDAVSCPNNLLGEFQYTYTDATGTYCDTVNTSLISACDNQNLTIIQVDNTGCTQQTPFFSSGGALGCLVSVYSSMADIYFTSLWNFDSTIAVGSTYQFTCVASSANSSDPNGIVSLSMLPTVCISGQTSTVLPSGGALMVLTPNCVPTATDDSIFWLIPVLLLIIFFIVLVIVGVCLYLRHRKFLREKAREKKILITEEHPLGEMSITLDAPASLERVALPFEESSRSETFKTPRSARKKGMANPLSESSLHLDFKGRSWSTFYSGKGLKSPHTMDTDPFTEMDNGMVAPLSQRGSRTPRSVMNQKQKSFIYDGKAKSMANGSVSKPLPITDGRDVYPDFENPDVVKRLNANSVRSMRTVYDPNDRYTYKAPSIAARSEKPRSIKAPSIKALSVKAPSVKAPSMKATTLKARSITAPSIKTRSVRTLGVKAPTAGAKLKGSRLTRSLTTTRIGSSTKRLTSPRKKAVARSNTVVMPNKESGDETNVNMADFLAGEMALTKVPSETERSRYSSKTGLSKTPRKKSTQPSVAKPTEQMTDEEKIDEIMKVNTELVQGTINPSEMRRDSFFSKTRSLSKSVLKPKASKKPWKG